MDFSVKRIGDIVLSAVSSITSNRSANFKSQFNSDFSISMMMVSSKQSTTLRNEFLSHLGSSTTHRKDSGGRGPDHVALIIPQINFTQI